MIRLQWRVYLRSLFLNALFFVTKPLLFVERADIVDHAAGSIHRTVSTAILRTHILQALHIYTSLSDIILYCSNYISPISYKINIRE